MATNTNTNTTTIYNKIKGTGIKAKKDIAPFTAIQQFNGKEHMAAEFESMLKNMNEQERFKRKVFAIKLCWDPAMPHELKNTVTKIDNYGIVIDPLAYGWERNYSIFAKDINKTCDSSNYNCILKPCFNRGWPSAILISTKYIKKGEPLSTHWNYNLN